jgi:uncharacterized damage-inducible protein DinB
MSLLAHLTSLRDHGEWADRRLLEAVRAASAPAAIRELAHVRGAQEIWLSRIEQRPPTIPIWPELSAEELATVGAAMDAAWRTWFSELSEGTLSRPVSYKNLAGDPYTTPLSEILLHTMLHGQYHRGKASVALRAATGAAVSVDYMLWQWSGAPSHPA